MVRQPRPVQAPTNSQGDGSFRTLPNRDTGVLASPVRSSNIAGGIHAPFRQEANMAKQAQAIPKGYHTVTASLIVAGATRAIDFYKEALGAEELMRFPGP